jgi:hypothetical protein
VVVGTLLCFCLLTPCWQWPAVPSRSCQLSNKSMKRSGGVSGECNVTDAPQPIPWNVMNELRLISRFESQNPHKALNANECNKTTVDPPRRSEPSAVLKEDQHTNKFRTPENCTFQGEQEESLPVRCFFQLETTGTNRLANTLAACNSAEVRCCCC